MTDEPEVLPPAPKMANELLYARFQGLVLELGIKQSVISQETGVREPAISDAMRKQTGLENHWPVIFSYFANKHRVNPDWFLRGQLPKFFGDTVAPGTTPSGLHPALNDPPSDRIRLAGPSMRELGVVNLQHRMIKHDLPKTRTVAAPGIIQVLSDDMSPVIRSGQWIILAGADRLPHDGDIVVCETETGTWVRRIRTVAGEDVWLLEGANQSPHVRTIFVKKGEVRNLTVVTGVLFE